MAKADYYELLGATRGASQDELKRAYRKLAMKYHPDRNPDDTAAEQKFKEINEAYGILKDEQKRAAYDQFGHAAFEGGGPGAGGRGNPFSGSGFADIFDEMFGDFMGGGRRRGAGTRGDDLRYNLEISLEDAFNGRETSIRVPSSTTCDSCKGSGSDGAAEPVSCSGCNGTGNVRMQQGFFTIQRTCPNCNGQGRVIRNPCRTCGGAGNVRREKTLSVNIPAGVDDGTRIRLSGEGEADPRRGSPGDLYIFISVAPHRLFKRDGADLHCNVPLPMMEAALGGQIDVPSIDGTKARVTIPDGTQTGAQFRLRGKGMSALRSPNRGDMYVRIAVETPRNLTRKQKELLREFAQAGGDNRTHPESTGFFERVKEFLGGRD